MNELCHSLLVTKYSNSIGRPVIVSVVSVITCVVESLKYQQLAK